MSRLVMNLPAQVEDLLLARVAAESSTKTAVAIRALQLYGYLRDATDNGGKIIVQHEGEPDERVTFL